MPAPGYQVIIGETPASSLVAADASNGFLVGGAQRGPLDSAQLIVSLADFINKCGGKIEGFPTTYNTVKAFFAEGGTALYFSREVGSSAAVATKNLVDAAGKIALKLKAFNAGAWGNSLKASVTNVSSKLSGTISLEGKTLLTFSEVASNAALITLINEKLGATYVKAETGEAEAVIAKTQELTFTGGSDALNALTTATLETALANFNRDLGPGQVFSPIHTTEAAHKAIMLSAETNGRVGVLDHEEIATAAQLAERAAALSTQPGARFSALTAPWAEGSGDTRGSVITVPYSAIYCGQVARAEALGYSPNKPPAGKKRGTCEYAFDLVKTFTDAELGTLNDAGVLCAKLVRGTPTTFGNVTLVNQSGQLADWKSFSGSRTVMVAGAKGGEVLENYEFEDVDGHGYVFNDLKGDLTNEAAMPLYKQNALYGTTPEEAFAVETGPDVNTPTTISAGEIRAQIALRVSPTGERLTLEIVKVPFTVAL